MNPHQPDAPTQLAEDTDWAGDELREECGVFGIFGHEDATTLVALGLQALQHRGQEAAGIVSSDGKQFYAERRMGLVSDSFTKPSVMKRLAGNSAIGHVRYSTTGETVLRNVQPLFADLAGGGFALAHNGNLTNAAQLREELELDGSIFQTTVDSEIILHLMARPSDNGENNLVQSLQRIEGAYSLVIMTENELIGVRDPHGFRPLSIAKLDGAYVLSSETCAFDLIQAEFVRDVEPGEIVIINKDGIKSINAFPMQERRAFCIFEYVYFARPDSRISDRSVYQVRVNMGRELAKETAVDADLVVPVPDSGNCASLGYSLESGIPYEMAFVRNHYVGRSFLQPSQLIRDFNVRVKLNLINELVEGKRVVIIDDSIVRGTTSKARVNNLKEAGAKEVHVRVSCPPHMNPCFYGIDMSTKDELFAARFEGGLAELEPEASEALGADSLTYLEVDKLNEVFGGKSRCGACFDGNYPEDVPESARQAIVADRSTIERGIN